MAAYIVSDPMSLGAERLVKLPESGPGYQLITVAKSKKKRSGKLVPPGDYICFDSQFLIPIQEFDNTKIYTSFQDMIVALDPVEVDELDGIVRLST